MTDAARRKAENHCLPIDLFVGIVSHTHKKQSFYYESCNWVSIYPTSFLILSSIAAKTFSTTTTCFFLSRVINRHFRRIIIRLQVSFNDVNSLYNLNMYDIWKWYLHLEPRRCNCWTLTCALLAFLALFVATYEQT